jgi:hypothetical protein
MMSSVLPSTTGRVPQQTADDVNRCIHQCTVKKGEHFARRGREAIDRRLTALDEEWDIERTLEANAAIVTVVSVALGSFVDRRFFLMPAVIGGFLLQHALQGWCPPLPIFRRLGVRTQSEIDLERYALKALRGDFRDVRALSEGDGHLEIQQAVRAARR